MKTKLGDIMADLGENHPGEGRNKCKIGVAFIDSATQQISLKIDSIPLPGWKGWANVYKPRPKLESEGPPVPSDEVPF